MGIEKPLHGTFSVGGSGQAGLRRPTACVDRPGEKPSIRSISQDSELIQLGGRSINARAYVSRFNFSGADQEKKCGVLSGGERNRLHLALALKEEGNVLLLDEPTNDHRREHAPSAGGRFARTSQAAPSSSRTTAGFWTASRPIFWPSRATRKSYFSRADTASTRRTSASGSATTRPHRVKYRKLMAD